MMTAPVTVGKHVTLSEAHRIMQEKDIRHLPVLEGGVILGVISDRDIRTFSGLKTVDMRKETVEEACTLVPYVVSPHEKLDQVCAEMAENKYGSVLVQDGNKIVGIFTWVDALRAMDELLNELLRKGPRVEI